MSEISESFDEAAQKLEKKKRSQLFYITVGAIIFNLLALIIFGSAVVFSHIFKREVAFQPGPEALKTIDPRKMEHKVKVQESQQSSGRPQVQPRLQSSRVANIALPAIEVETTAVKDALQKNILQNFSTAGVGTGLGTGSGSGGLGLGASKVNFFGIQAVGERIVFIIDVSLSMVEDIRGGLPGFEVLKNEVREMVDKLNEGTFFNLIAFDSSVDVFKPRLELANKQMKTEAKEFIAPYFEGYAERLAQETSSANLRWPRATRLNNYRPPASESLKKFVWAGFSGEENTSGHGSTRLDLALMAAFEMKADTIFVISDGNPVIYRALFGKEREAYEKNVERQKEAVEKRREQFFKDLEKTNQMRARRGLPPKVMEGAPGLVPPHLTHKEVLEYLRAFMVETYGEDRKKYPRIYGVSYGADTGQEAFLRELARDYKGRFRKIRGLARPISD